MIQTTNKACDRCGRVISSGFHPVYSCGHVICHGCSKPLCPKCGAQAVVGENIPSEKGAPPAS